MLSISFTDGHTTGQLDEKQKGETHLYDVIMAAVFYLRTWFIQVYAAGVHVLRHDDKGQKVRGGERACVAAGRSGSEEEISSMN